MSLQHFNAQLLKYILPLSHFGPAVLKSHLKIKILTLTYI